MNCTYDGFNRLKEVCDNSGETVYTYDANGLRSSKITDRGIERYVYDNGQLVATIVPPATALFDGTIPASGSADVNFSLTYDRTYYEEVNGTLHTATAALWTQEDINLTAVPVGGGETPEVPVEPPDPDEPPAFLGVMTALTVEDVTIITSDSQNGVIEAPAGTVVRVYANDPTMTDVAYIRGLNLIASRTNEAITYYHYNAHGDVVQTTTAYGAVVHDYSYDAFGVERNAAEGDANPFRYCGEQFDAETGNYYLRARTYSPTTGQFTQEDTIRDGLNWYAYCSMSWV